MTKYTMRKGIRRLCYNITILGMFESGYTTVNVPFEWALFTRGVSLEKNNDD
jgi:hypothetical protein